MQACLPTGSVAVWFTAGPRDRNRRLSFLDDARIRAGSTPGLTSLASYLGSKSDAALIEIGA